MTEGLSNIDTNKLKYPVETDVVDKETSSSEKKEDDKKEVKKSSVVSVPIFDAKAENGKTAKETDMPVFSSAKEEISISKVQKEASVFSAGADTTSEYGDTLQLSRSTSKKSTVRRKRYADMFRKKMDKMDADEKTKFAKTSEARYGRYASDEEISLAKADSSTTVPEKTESVLSKEDKERICKLLEQYGNDVEKVGAKKAAKKLLHEVRDMKKPELKKKFIELLREKKADKYTFGDEFKKMSDIQTMVTDVILEDDETPTEEKQDVLHARVDDIPVAQKENLELVEEVLPEDITQEQAEELLSSVNEYSLSQQTDIIAHVATHQHEYSEDFQSEIINKCSKIHADTIKRTNEFIKHFWETPKGKAIIAYTRHVVEELKEKKEVLQEKREEAKIKTEEAEEAKKAAEEATNEAQKAKTKAEEAIAEIGIKKDLRKDVMKKVLKQTSPKQFSKLEEAESKQYKAETAERDASIEKENAIHNAGIIAKSLMIIKMRAMALMSMIRGCFN